MSVVNCRLLSDTLVFVLVTWLVLAVFVIAVLLAANGTSWPLVLCWHCSVVAS